MSAYTVPALCKCNASSPLLHLPMPVFIFCSTFALSPHLPIQIPQQLCMQHSVVAALIHNGLVLHTPAGSRIDSWGVLYWADV